jgi:hypothetical protein
MASSTIPIPPAIERLTTAELYTAVRITQDRLYLAHSRGNIIVRNLEWERLSLLEARLAHAESNQIHLGRVCAAIDGPLHVPTVRRRSRHSAAIVLGLCGCCGLACVIWSAL